MYRNYSTEYCPQYQTQQRLTFLTDLNYSTVYLLRLFGQEFGCLYDVVVFQRPAMMSVEKGYFYTDASCLVTEYCKHGSVLVGTHTEYQWLGGHTQSKYQVLGGHTQSMYKYQILRAHTEHHILGGGGHTEYQILADTHSPSCNYWRGCPLTQSNYTYTNSGGYAHEIWIYQKQILVGISMHTISNRAILYSYCCFWGQYRDLDTWEVQVNIVPPG